MTAFAAAVTALAKEHGRVERAIAEVATETASIASTLSIFALNSFKAAPIPS